MFKWAVSIIVMLGLAISHAPALIHGAAYLDKAKWECGYTSTLSECLALLDLPPDVRSQILSQRMAEKPGASQ